MHALAAFTVIAGITAYACTRVMIDAYSVFAAVVRSGAVAVVETFGSVDALTLDTTVLFGAITVV